MVHGGCRSVGCYAMTNDQIEEIYGLAYDAFGGGQRDIQLQALPFRMTGANLARHRTDPNFPFWTMLAAGSELFERTGEPPRVTVCNQQYVFSPAGSEGGACSTSAS
jgi:murein L,D-transpeptidase YafK